MRLFNKLFLLLIAVSAAPMALAAALLAWQAQAAQRELLGRVADHGVRAQTLGAGALNAQARRHHLQLVRDRAERLESAFESVRRAVLLSALLAQDALTDQSLPPNAPPIYEGDEAAALLQTPRVAASVRAREPYVVYHLAPDVSLEHVKPSMGKLRRLGAYFAHQQKFLPWCRSSFVGHRDGFILGYPGGVAFSPEFDHRQRPWYVKAMTEKRLVWTKPYIDRDGKTVVMTYAAPVRDAKGELVAVAAIDVKIGAIIETLFDLGVVPVSEAVLIDEKGQVRVSASQANLGGLAAASGPGVAAFLGGRFLPAYRELARRQEQDSGIIDAGGADLFSYARVALRASDDEAKSWHYIVQTPGDQVARSGGEIKGALDDLYRELSAQVNAGARRRWIQIHLMISAAFLLALPLAYAAARAAVKPLSRLSETVRRIALGDLDQRVEPAAADELGLVAESINRMARGLKESLFLKDPFKRYVAGAVMDRLIKDPGQLKLGGEKRELTVFFSDIQGFTALAEKLPPERLVELVNEYLAAMTEAIFAREGTLDKYEGDAIMAFWGAPIAQDDHAVRACLAALDNQDALKRLRMKWEKRGLPPIEIRIGLNTGSMVVGNMGSLVKMDYTVAGGAVSLGRRLETANKIYGTRIMASEATFQAAKGRVEAREIDWLAVKGKVQTIRVYELVGRVGELSRERLEGYRLFEAGLAAYRRRDWDAAEAGFRRADIVLAGDSVSWVFLDRLARWRKRPPPDDWDGAFILG